eukprot:1569191-Ditylum_brightwellii.AAC.1
MPYLPCGFALMGKYDVTAGLYLQARRNATFCKPMVPASCLTEKNLADWLEDGDSMLRVWQEHFSWLRLLPVETAKEGCV